MQELFSEFQIFFQQPFNLPDTAIVPLDTGGLAEMPGPTSKSALQSGKAGIRPYSLPLSQPAAIRKRHTLRVLNLCF